MTSVTARLYWVDYLRMAMILLVVNMHACVTYSHVGDWYYMVGPEPSFLDKLPFLYWQGHLQSFFMGLLFFLAGYFAERSLRRRGVQSFLAERSWRLGIPTLFYMLVLHPFILLALNPWRSDFPPFLTFYSRYLFTGKFVGSSGPLWFAFALLLFCSVFAVIHLVFPQRMDAPERKAVVDKDRYSLRQILLLGAGLGVITFAIRLLQPIGSSILNFQFCFFPQYVVAFALGVAISRREGLASLAAAPALHRAGILALCLGPIFLTIIALLGGPPPAQGPAPYDGGWHWQALGLALWEQMTGVGLGAGMLAWFSRNLNRENPLLNWLSDRSFGVYVFHAPVLVALTLLVRPLGGPILIMAPALTLIALIASFLFADLVRRIPFLASVF